MAESIPSRKQDGTARSRDSDDAAFAVYSDVMRYFCELYSRPHALAELLAKVDCAEANKAFVTQKYRVMFGPDIVPPSPRHVRWYRRMAPLLSLSKGSSILDYGGGYGIDAIFFAALGYDVLLYEVTPNQLVIARAFAESYSKRTGPLAIRYIHAGRDEMPRQLDAVMLKETAHHIEPVRQAFDNAARMLREGGRLFLLEPNFFNPVIQANFLRIRGFRTVERRIDPRTGAEFLVGNENIRSPQRWNAHAEAAGLTATGSRYYIPWPGVLPVPADWQRVLDRVPLLRHVAASHLTLEYVKR